MTKNIFEKIIAIYPELATNTDVFANKTIHIQNDSDGIGDYLVKWDYSEPIPAGLIVGKPK